MKLTPKQSAMAPRALTFIRDDFARQDAAEVRHWGKHLHGGVGVSNVAVSEHLGMGKKDTISLLDKLVGAGLLAQVSEYTGTAEQRRGWAGGGARNFHKEHWNYNAVTYTVRSYRITPLGEEWLAAQTRSNPANLSEADERELDQLVGRIGDNIAETVQAGRHGWSSLEQAINLHRDHAEVEWREHGGAAPFASIWPRIQAQVRRELGSIRDRFARSNPAPMEVQALLFDRELWTPRRAEAWLRRHDYAGLDLDVKPNTYRYRQHDPDLFRPRSFRTIAFGEETGIQAVVGKRKRGAPRANVGGWVEQPDCWSSGAREVLSPAEADRGQWRCPRCGRVLKVRVRQGRDGAASEATIPKHKPTPGSAEYRSNPKALSAPRISPENEFIGLFRVRDAFAGRETLSKDIIEEVAWELGYEGEPYVNIARFEGMAAGFGADLRGAHARGAAEAPRRNPGALTEAQERALVSMPDRPHAYTELPKRTGLALCRAGLAEAKSFGYATLDQPVGAERFERTQRHALEFTLTDKGRAYRAALKSRA